MTPRYRVKRRRFGYSGIGRILVKPWLVQSTLTGKHWCTEAWCENYQTALNTAVQRAYLDQIA